VAFCCADLAVSAALFATFEVGDDVLCRTLKGDRRRARSACAVCLETSARYMIGSVGNEMSFGMTMSLGFVSGHAADALAAKMVPNFQGHKRRSH
jgi:hypothetical protein